MERMNLEFSSKISDFAECNESFDKCKLYVCYSGKNRNKSNISRETLERCAKTIYNRPIVCRYDRDSNEIGGHDVELVKSESGDFSIVNTTHPVGVVPESASYSFENVEEEDGTVHEYLCAEALLWKRQEAYSKIKENGITGESMEITVKEGSTMDDGYYDITDFEFTAFCLLGTVEPCFESASVVTFSKEQIQAEFDQMLSDFRNSMNDVQAAFSRSHNNEAGSTEGGEDMEEKDYTLEAAPETGSVEGVVVNSVIEENPAEKFEKELSEERAQHEKDVKELEDLKEKYSKLLEETEELRKFKADVEKEKADSERADVFAKFEDLEGNESFAALKEEAENYSLDVLEEKCYAIRGRVSEPDRKMTFSRKNTKLPAGPEVKPEVSPYGGLFEKYGH